ncbi:GntR family transcriptional regulator [Virgibacillus halophilus]|uniref:GntR family transcriptional regulator n=1 Tax=Tigheibacillus halophilus TaxID=361280 RepID=UPI003638F717
MSIKTDSRHLYLQVIDKIKQDIQQGEYAEGEKLPSEFQLSKELGVSRATLREALRVLEEENVIVRRHGVGTFVNPKPVFSSGIELLSSVTDMIEASGKEAASQFLSTELVDATIEETSCFAPKKVDKLIAVERVRTADMEPVVFCIDKIPEGLVPLHMIHRADSLFGLMEKHLNKRISYAISYIEPISYHDRIYEILNCSTDQALLLLNQMHYTEDDEPVLYSSNYFRSDMFRFHVLRKRP